ncbi:MAG: ImmA/IrrE family metallo-endopeptidase [Oscillospiraceae bacterium]|nr:ImmA/IrrE family metallo-endopeptidase [Oscillospiraceae bacterium]
MTMYPYSNAALETFARNIITQYDPNLLNTPAPIPVEAIMEKCFGLSIEFRHIRKNGRVLGETIFEDTMVAVYERRNGEGYKLIPVKGGTVILDVNLMNKRSDGRFRFTCAHELLHYIKHRDYFVRQGETAAMTKNEPDTDTARMLERQAERFAAYLLMPKKTVKMAYHRLMNRSGDKTKTLASLFEVSVLAMGYRLQEMGLHT